MKKQVYVTCGAPDSHYPGYSNRQIQAAIDYAAFLGGGIVQLSDGIYHLADSIHIKTGVALCGNGSHTVLIKDAMVESPSIHIIGFGHCEIMVQYPERFEPGMGVYITDKQCYGGFLATQSTITAIEDNTLYLKDPLFCDVNVNRNGLVRTLYPLIKGSFQKNFSIQNIVLDGNSENNGIIDGCRGGGVFLIGCSNAEIKDIECTNYNLDGISYQQCYNITIDNCNIHHNRGSGIHPGSGSIKSSITNCHVHHNGTDGIYYCLRAQYILLKDCLIEDNGRTGISVGHHDDYTDILYNTVRNNGGEGLLYRSYNIPFSSGKFATIAFNHFENNATSTEQPYPADIHLKESAESVRIHDNVVYNTAKIPMLIDKKCKDTIIYRNNFTPQTAEENAPDWYSDQEPDQERYLNAFPITEATLQHLKHICR